MTSKTGCKEEKRKLKDSKKKCSSKKYIFPVSFLLCQIFEELFGVFCNVHVKHEKNANFSYFRNRSRTYLQVFLFWGNNNCICETACFAFESLPCLSPFSRPLLPWMQDKRGVDERDEELSPLEAASQPPWVFFLLANMYAQSFAQLFFRKNF